jgi:hypothetical protein
MGRARVASLRGTITRALLVVAAAISAPAARADAPPLVARARSMHLAASAGWTKLLHYRSSLIVGRGASEVRSAGFFLAEDGRTDPEAELEATLRAFEEPVRPGHEDAHALCRFPARRAWLDAALHFEGAMRSVVCPAYERFRADLDPTSIAVVYSAPFLGDAASAMGHAFLLVHKRRPPGSDERSERIDHAVDFVAAPDTKNPVVFAFKGLAGLFPGTVRISTYEAKVLEYGGHEERDLWEYEIALTPAELDLYTRHLFELTRANLEYFYLRKNCAYTTLASIEAAAPRIDVLSKLNAVVLPEDAIRAIDRAPGVVANVVYRPSMESNLRVHARTLSEREKELGGALARDPSTPLPPALTVEEDEAAIDAALLALDAEYGRVKPAEEADLMARRAALVARRAGLPPHALPSPLPAPLEKSPARTHGSMRVTLGGGDTTQYRSPFVAVGYRLVLHDLVDPPNGQSELSQVQLLDLQIREEIVHRRFTVDRATFVDMMTLNPLTPLEQHLSWKVTAFGMRLHDAGCPDCFAHGAEGALGAALATPNERVALFAMGDLYVAFSGAPDGVERSGVRLGGGPYGGLRVHLPGDVVGLVTGKWSYLPWSSLRTTYDVRASVRGPLAQDVAVGIEGAIQPVASEAVVEAYAYF